MNIYFYYPNPNPYLNIPFNLDASFPFKVEQAYTALGESLVFLHDHHVAHADLAIHYHLEVDRFEMFAISLHARDGPLPPTKFVL